MPLTMWRTSLKHGSSTTMCSGEYQNNCHRSVTHYITITSWVYTSFIATLYMKDTDCIIGTSLIAANYIWCVQPNILCIWDAVLTQPTHSHTHTPHTQLTTLELQYVSPKLLACHDLELAVPGTYEPNQPIIHIKKVTPSLNVITSKQTQETDHTRQEIFPHYQQ